MENDGKTRIARAAILIGLVGIGSVQMIGDVLQIPALRAVGIALGASPAPKVFTAQNGFETYSSRFFVHWHDAAGEPQRMAVTPRVYRGVEGPYNRRNAYGAALSYGPVLAASPATRAMFESAFRFAMCREGGIVEELGIAPNRALPLGVELQPREANSRDARWQLAFDVTCTGDQL